ncbi:MULTISPECIES: septum formation family protein [Actinoalloteichus]|nr:MULTISPECIES: septum formation family protein [Actinoalloteichus]
MNTRLVMIGAAAGALIVLTASALSLLPGDRSGGGPGGGGGRPGAGPQQPQQAALLFETEPGECLTWAESDASDIRPVTCAEPHLFEVSGSIDLATLPAEDAADDEGADGTEPEGGGAGAGGVEDGEPGTDPSDSADEPEPYGEDAPFPDTDIWLALKDTHCLPQAADYLDGLLDPYGRFRVNAFTPSAESWEEGDRTMHCGLQWPATSGGLYPIVGEVATLDQANVHEPGVCLGINGGAVTDPVDCAEPHSQEIIEVYDLSEGFDVHPSDAQQDEYLQPLCRQASTDYAGGPVSEQGLIYAWDLLPLESWEAGTRHVKCYVAAVLPDESGIAPITGSVRGEFEVSDEEAAPEENTVTPGAPLPNPTGPPMHGNPDESGAPESDENGDDTDEEPDETDPEGGEGGEDTGAEGGTGDGG